VRSSRSSSASGPSTQWRVWLSSRPRATFSSAPSIALITALKDLGADVRAYDPAGMAQAKAVIPDDISYCDSPYSAAAGAHAVVLVTEWEQFRALDFARLKATMAAPVFIDLKNVYQPEDIADLGFTYESVGRPRQN